MDFEIDNDDDNYDYLDTSSLSNTPSPRYTGPQRSNMNFSSSSPSAYSFPPKKDKSPVYASASDFNKQKARQSSSTFFGSNAGDDEDDYNFDLGDKGYKNQAAKSLSSSSIKPIGDTRQSIGTEKLKEPPTSTMSSLDKAQSILSRYSQSSIPKASFKKATDVFDEDDISIDSGDDENDDDAGFGKFSSSVYGSKPKKTSPITSIPSKPKSKVDSFTDSQVEESDEDDENDFSVEQSSESQSYGSGLSRQISHPSLSIGQDSKKSETSKPPNKPSLSPKDIYVNSSGKVLVSKNSAKSVEESYSDYSDEETSVLEESKNTQKSDRSDYEDEVYEDEDINEYSKPSTVARQPSPLPEDMDDEPYKPKIMSFQELASTEDEESNQYGSEDFEAQQSQSSNISESVNKSAPNIPLNYTKTVVEPSPTASKPSPLWKATIVPVDQSNDTSTSTNTIKAPDLRPSVTSPRIEQKPTLAHQPPSSSFLHHQTGNSAMPHGNQPLSHQPALSQPPQQNVAPQPNQIPQPGQIPLPSQMPQPGQMPLPSQIPQPGQIPLPSQMPQPGQMPQTNHVPPANQIPPSYPYDPYHTPHTFGQPVPPYPQPGFQYPPQPLPQQYPYYPSPSQQYPQPYAPPHNYYPYGVPPFQASPYGYYPYPHPYPFPPPSQHANPQPLYSSFPNIRESLRASKPSSASSSLLDIYNASKLLKVPSESNRSSDSVLLDLLRELKEAKEEAAQATQKLAEVLAIASKNKSLNSLLAASFDPKPTSKPDSKQVASDKRDGEVNLLSSPPRIGKGSTRYPTQTSQESAEVKNSKSTKPSEEEYEDEYSNDFENSQSMNESSLQRDRENINPQPSLTTEGHPKRSSDLEQELDKPNDFDFTKPLLMSQVLYQQQLQSLKDRLKLMNVATASPTDIEALGRSNRDVDAVDDLHNTQTFNVPVSYSSTPSLIEIKKQFEERRRSNVDKFVRLLQEIDPNINSSQSKSIVDLYLS